MIWLFYTWAAGGLLVWLFDRPLRELGLTGAALWPLVLLSLLISLACERSTRTNKKERS